MKYLKLYESFEDIHEICKKYAIKNYNINDDGSIDVYGNVSLSYRYLKKLPLKFNKVSGIFNCSYNSLTTLEGSPIETGDFGCRDNILTSFEFAPKIIRGFFCCQNNNINSFEYFPSFVKGFFDCQNYNYTLNINRIYHVWKLFEDTSKIELLNDCDIFCNENTRSPGIFIDRLNDFLEMIGKPSVMYVDYYSCY